MTVTQLETVAHWIGGERVKATDASATSRTPPRVR